MVVGIAREEELFSGAGKPMLIDSPFAWPSLLARQSYEPRRHVQQVPQLVGKVQYLQDMRAKADVSSGTPHGQTPR